MLQLHHKHHQHHWLPAPAAAACSGFRKQQRRPQRRRAAAVPPLCCCALPPSAAAEQVTDARGLNGLIQQAGSTLELLQLHAAHRHRLDAIHCSIFFTRLLRQQEQQQQQQQEQHTNSSSPPHQQQLEQQQLLLDALLQDLPALVGSMQPGPITVALRALANLQQPQHSSHQQHHHQQLLCRALLHRAHQVLGLGSFNPRQLCYLAHALVDLQPVQLPWTASASFQQQQQHAGSCCWDPVLLQDLFYALGGSMQRCNAQDAAQAVLAVARLRYAPSQAWLQVWLLRAHQLLPHFTPQGLANAAYGLVRALELRGELESSGSYDWASEGVSSTSSHSSSQLQAVSTPLQPGALLAAAQSWLQCCLKVSVLHLGSMKPQELTGQLLWAAGKLSCMPGEPARHNLLAAAEALLPSCDARHLCSSLYAFARLGHRPGPRAAAAFWDSLALHVPDLAQQDLAQLLWSAAKLQLQPPLHVREQLQQHALMLLGDDDGSLGQHQHQQHASTAGPAAIGSSRNHHHHPRYLVGVLRGMSGLRWQLQEQYVLRFQAALEAQLGACVPQDYSNMLWALSVAEAEAAPEPRWLDRVLVGARQCLEQFNPQELANTLGALGQLQHSPPKAWTQQLLLVCLQQMSQFKPADYAQTLSGLARLGFSPSPLWLNSFWSKSGQSLTGGLLTFTAAELHALLLAVVALEAQPPQKWVQAAAAAVEQGMAGFGSQQLLEVLQALQQLWQASCGPATAAAAAAVVEQRTSSSSSNRRGEQLSSSVVAISSRHRALLQLQLRAASSRSQLLSARYNPGVVRLYRQLSVSQVARPARPPLCSSSSSSLRGVLQQQQHEQQLGLSCADEAYSLACLVLLMPPTVRSRVEHWPARWPASQRTQQVAGYQLLERQQQQQQPSLQQPVS